MLMLRGRAVRRAGDFNRGKEKLTRQKLKEEGKWLTCFVKYFLKGKGNMIRAYLCTVQFALVSFRALGFVNFMTQP